MLLIKQLQNLNFDFSKLPADVKMSIDVIADLTKSTFNDTNNQKIQVLDNAVFTAIKNLYPKDEKVINVSISRAVNYFKNENAGFNTVQENVFKSGGEVDILLAPNGKPSNLTAEQYKLVRTPEFKAWFGDWENSPETASKVVDDNGEPMVVYHTDNYPCDSEKHQIKIFNIEQKYEKTKLQTPSGKAFYFALDTDLVLEFSKCKYDVAKDRIYKLFLNVRNPANSINNQSAFAFDDIENINRSIENNILCDGVFLHNFFFDETLDSNMGYADQVVVFNSNQIKLADGTNTTFYANNPDIRFEEGGSTVLTVYHGTQSKFVADIKKNGLKDKTGYNQGWYMVSTDLESALYHATPDDKKDYVYVFEFAIPIIENDRWLGYPYLWKETKRNDKSSWFALMQKIPSKFIKEIHKIPYEDYLLQKSIGFKDGGKISSEGYERKREWAARRMVDNKKIETLTEDQHDALSNLCSVRHNFHVNLDRLVISDSENIKKDLINANIELVESGLIPMNFIPNSEDDFIDIDDFQLLNEIEQIPENEDEKQNWYDDNYSRIYGELSNLNTNIENYLSEIDLKYGTNYKPSGASRFKDGGDVIDSAVKTAEFKAWFMDSKVVDKHNKPLVVYHGSPDFRGFKEDYVFKTQNQIFFNHLTEEAKSVKEKGAFYFTDSYSIAKSYANPMRAFDYQNAEEGVMSFYLSLQNPFIIDAENQIWRKFELVINDTKLIGTRKMVEYAQANGYDGIIIKNVIDYYNANDGKKAKGSNVYVAFYPTQVKLANGNTTFNPENPDVRFDKGGNIYRSVGIEGYLVGKSRNPYIGTEKEVKCSADNIRCFVSDSTYRFIFTVKNKNVSVLHFDKEDSYWISSNAYTLEEYRKKGYAKALYKEAKKHLKLIVFSRNLSPMGTMFKQSVHGVFKVGGVAEKKVPRDFDTDLGVSFGQKFKTGEIIVAHSTSSNLLPKIYKEGLLSDSKKVWKDSSEGQLFFEIEPTHTQYGENVYGWKATQKYGGTPVTLYVKIKQNKLRTDLDDADLGVGYQKNQKTCSCDVPPEDIIGLRVYGIDVKREDFIQFYKMEKGMKKDGGIIDEITFDNFFDDTFADFNKIRNKEIPHRKPDFISNSGSKYWYEEDTVYRESNHWGRTIASCNWLLNSCAVKGLSQGKCKLVNFKKQQFDLLKVGEQFKITKTVLLQNGHGCMSIEEKEGVYLRQTSDYYIFDTFKVAKQTLATVNLIIDDDMENKMLFGGSVADKYKVAQIQGGDWIIYDVKSENIVSQNKSRSVMDDLHQTIIKTPSLHNKIQSNIKAGVEPMKFADGGRTYNGLRVPKTVDTNLLVSAFENAMDFDKIEEYTDVYREQMLSNEFPPILGHPSILDEGDIGNYFMNGDEITEDDLGKQVWMVTDGHHRSISAINAKVPYISVELDYSTITDEKELKQGGSDLPSDLPSGDLPSNEFPAEIEFDYKNRTVKGSGVKKLKEFLEEIFSIDYIVFSKMAMEYFVKTNGIIKETERAKFVKDMAEQFPYLIYTINTGLVKGTEDEYQTVIFIGDNEYAASHKQIHRFKEGGQSEPEPKERLTNVTEICSRIRAYLKEKYPTMKFSVRKQHTSSLSVNLLQADFNPFVEENLDDYQKKSRNIQLNQYYLKDDKRLTDKAKAILEDVIKYSNQWNWNHSDYMTDYYDVNYYFHIEIGEWNKPFEVVEVVKRPELPKRPERAELPAELPKPKGQVNVLRIVEYSDKSVVIIGDTYPIKSLLKELGGFWNNRASGWLFPKSKIEGVKKLIIEAIGKDIFVPDLEGALVYVKRLRDGDIMEQGGAVKLKDGSVMEFQDIFNKEEQFAGIYGIVNNQLVGAIRVIGDKVIDGKKYYFLSSESWQKQGVFESLYKKLLEYAKEDGYDGLYSESLTSAVININILSKFVVNFIGKNEYVITGYKNKDDNKLGTVENDGKIDSKMTPNFIEAKNAEIGKRYWYKTGSLNNGQWQETGEWRYGTVVSTNIRFQKLDFVEISLVDSQARTVGEFVPVDTQLYYDKPEYKSSVCIVLKGDSILLGKAKSDDKRNGTLCFVGGGIKQGETLYEAAVRECKEESGLTVKVLKKLSYPNLKTVSFVVCEFISGEVKHNHEFENMAFYPLNDLPDNIYPNNIEIINHLIAVKEAFKAGQQQVYEDLEQTTLAPKFESFEEWFSSEMNVKFADGGEIIDNITFAGEPIYDNKGELVKSFYATNLWERLKPFNTLEEAKQFIGKNILAVIYYVFWDFKTSQYYSFKVSGI